MDQDRVSYDLAVIGGGINGCGIARDAALRGLKVLLLEKGDLAQATSSSSTKLIHGGLRYLEHYAFGLVRKALIERETLLSIAPHIIWPLRFVLPHRPQMRPVWLLRLGLFLYDHLGRRSLLPESWLIKADDSIHQLLEQTDSPCFEYSDAWVDDARLVVLNALDAREHGATILTRCKVTQLSSKPGRWTIAADHKGQPECFEARTVINAAGPWADRALFGTMQPSLRLRLVKGSHIVVRRWHDDPRCLILQIDDGRIVFVIPYEQDFCLIGTTDTDYQGDPGEAQISEDEIAYLCAAVSRQCRHKLTPRDVVWSYAGVRPLIDDGHDNAQETTRDYRLVRQSGQGRPPALSVIGGKITTYRLLAEQVMDLMAPDLPGTIAQSTTGCTALPGGDFAPDGFDALYAETCSAHPELPQHLIRRLLRQYGTRTSRILDGCHTMVDLGQLFDADLTAREVDYLIAEEWAETVDDILWRRSKQGLRFSDNGVERLRAYLDNRS